MSLFKKSGSYLISLSVKCDKWRSNRWYNRLNFGWSISYTATNLVFHRCRNATSFVEKGEMRAVHGDNLLFSRLIWIFPIHSWRVKTIFVKYWSTYGPIIAIISIVPWIGSIVFIITHFIFSNYIYSKSMATKQLAAEDISLSISISDLCNPWCL